jgi:hypothetical protein
VSFITTSISKYAAFTIPSADYTVAVDQQSLARTVTFWLVAEAVQSSESLRAFAASFRREAKLASVPERRERRTTNFWGWNGPEIVFSRRCGDGYGLEIPPAISVASAAG